jgi:hypothetical protein
MKLTLHNKAPLLPHSHPSDEEPASHNRNSSRSTETMTGKPKVFWTDVETAFILNHADTCLKQQEDYNTTVSERLTAYAKREITKESVKNRLQRVLRDNNQKHTPGTFIQAGTACLNQLLLPSSLLEEMKSQQKKMGLEDMSAADVPAKTASQVPTSHASSSIAPINVGSLEEKEEATVTDRHRP